MEVNGKYVLVTTSHRGVFFGRLVEDNGYTVTLADARNCIYWSSSVKGFLGLASGGPDDHCRIGPRVPSINLRGITSVAQCTDAAVKNWEAEPWK